jgi:cell division protein FtsB
MEVVQDNGVSEVNAKDIDAALRQEMLDLAAENKRLEAQVVKLRAQKSQLSTKVISHWLFNLFSNI